MGYRSLAECVRDLERTKQLYDSEEMLRNGLEMTSRFSDGTQAGVEARPSEERLSLPRWDGLPHPPSLDSHQPPGWSQ